MCGIDEGLNLNHEDFYDGSLVLCCGRTSSHFTISVMLWKVLEG